MPKFRRDTACRLCGSGDSRCSIDTRPHRSCRPILSWVCTAERTSGTCHVRNHPSRSSHFRPGTADKVRALRTLPGICIRCSLHRRFQLLHPRDQTNRHWHLSDRRPRRRLSFCRMRPRGPQRPRSPKNDPCTPRLVAYLSPKLRKKARVFPELAHDGTASRQTARGTAAIEQCVCRCEWRRSSATSHRSLRLSARDVVGSDAWPRLTECVRECRLARRVNPAIEGRGW